MILLTFGKSSESRTLVRRLKVAGLVIVGLLIFVSIQVSMNVFTSWDTTTKASVWVAFGTLALAVVTVVSVLQSKALLSLEERRHQQAYAPILEFELDYDETTDESGSMHLRNGGIGPALTVKLHIEGKNGKGGTRFEIEETRSVIAVGGAWRIRGWDAYLEGPIRVDYDKSSVTYSDMFGNKFMTVLTNFWSSQSEWRPDQKLFTAALELKD